MLGANHLKKRSSVSSTLSKFQCEFRPNHSTVTSLIQMCSDGWKILKYGKLNGAVFLDIKSAFDSVNHDILITKVNEHLVSLVWTSTVF